MASDPLAGFMGYQHKTPAYQSTGDGEIKLDVPFPTVKNALPTTELLHYHGGFLVSIVTTTKRESEISDAEMLDCWSMRVWLANGSLSLLTTA